MKLVLALVVVLAAAAVAYVVVDPFGEDSGSSAGAAGAGTQPLKGSACRRLAILAGNLAARDRSPERFLVDLGDQAAGIRPGQLALIDLARDGRNIIVGRGFKAEFDDGTNGQVRHFVGVARATMFGGPVLTRWISENVRRDAADSPDGRLADEGTDFAQALLAGRLAPSGASAWIRERLCK
jgi:hypothetical protein